MSAQNRPVCPIRVLLAEDSPVQAALVEKAVGESACLELVHTARDGEAAIRFLHRTAQRGNDERIELILLDLNMPKKDGFAVLKDIKSDKRLRTIPVIVFTTSEYEEDVANSYARGASTFIVKPSNYEALRQVLEDMGRYWSHAKLSAGPTSDRGPTSMCA